MPAIGDLNRVLSQASHVTQNSKKQDTDTHLLSY